VQGASREDGSSRTRQKRPAQAATEQKTQTGIREWRELEHESNGQRPGSLRATAMPSHSPLGGQFGVQGWEMHWALRILPPGPSFACLFFRFSLLNMYVRRTYSIQVVRSKPSNVAGKAWVSCSASVSRFSTAADRSFGRRCRVCPCRLITDQLAGYRLWQVQAVEAVEAAQAVQPCSHRQVTVEKRLGGWDLGRWDMGDGEWRRGGLVER
jgi:hypothetical protein